MWKQIIPADDIFIHGENSSWKMLPHTDTSSNGSSPRQSQPVRKAASSELPNFSRVLPCNSASSSQLAPASDSRSRAKVEMAWGTQKDRGAWWEGLWGKDRESTFKGWRGARSCPGWWYGKWWPCIILYPSFSSGTMWKEQPALIIIHDLLVLG